jgi:DNA-binding response OmpR family regulator
MPPLSRTLTPIEQALLDALTAAHGAPVSNELLMMAVQIESVPSLYVQMHRLRRKLTQRGDTPPARWSGYILSEEET